MSELAAQDSYSYELADLVMGANNVDELERLYERAVKEMRFEIDDADPDATERCEATEESARTH